MTGRTDFYFIYKNAEIVSNIVVKCLQPVARREGLGIRTAL